jgi:acyl-CoA reductase-like NAD-dependent aldehyde dehydrogenase
MNLVEASKLSHSDWQQRAAELKKTAATGLFIGGEFVDAIEGGTFENICPVDGSVINVCAAGTQADIDKAVAIAKTSFKSGEWSRMAPRNRMAVMYKWAVLIEENGAELALMDTIDMGKPITDMVDVDIPMCIETIQYFAECIDKITGSITATEYDVMSTVIREPIGVVGCISPWNYPLLMALWKIAPSLAAGNSTILKPAEQTPLSCYRAAELFVEAGGPAGTLQVVNGLGEQAGQALARHMDVSKISFTGSTAVGKLMHVYSGESNMKKVSLECGGKGPQIFCEDLEGELLDRAVETAVNGIFFNMGQVCSAGSRLIVHSKIYDIFVEKFIAMGKDAYICGDPLDPSINLGPLIDHQSQARVLAMIGVAQAEGGTVEFGGEAAGGGLEAGAYVVPTMITGVSENDTIAQNEAFGPVVAVIKVDSDDEAIQVANNSIYGLQGSVWSDNFRRAMRFVREIECGTFLVNSFEEGDMTQPFGGYKQSGNAKDKCFESLLSYTNTKAAWFRLD